MRFGTMKNANGTQAFRQDDNGTYYYEQADVGELLRTENWESLTPIRGVDPHPENLTVPILQPNKILCVGLNYHDHAAEVGKEAPGIPTIFSKVSTSLVGPADDIDYPELSEKIDWEAELVIVIGKKIKSADIDTAREAIFGYTILNDVSVRDWQNRTTEWFQGKNFDNISPLGPVIVEAEHLDPIAGLKVETVVNDKIEQSGNTSQMIFNVYEIVTYISQFLTLEPGDLIATGTPAGVGIGRDPKQFLQRGDVLTTRIEGIGELKNALV